MATEHRHPIRVVSIRTGLTSHVIRVWEKRYNAVRPYRTPTNRRLYSDDDIARLSLLQRAIDGGRSIGQVASLPTTELKALVNDDHAVTIPAHGPSVGLTSLESALDDARRQIQEMNAGGLRDSLTRAAVSLSRASLLEDLVAPLLEEIGNGWREGDLRIAHEHMASAVLRTFLGEMIASANGTGGRLLLVTTPASTHHELGALMAAVAATLEGWRVCYLGPNLPAHEIAATAIRQRAHAVALSVIHISEPGCILDELRGLREMLPNMPLFVGGAAANRLESALGPQQVMIVDGLRQFRERLNTLQVMHATPDH